MWMFQGFFFLAGNIWELNKEKEFSLGDITAYPQRGIPPKLLMRFLPFSSVFKENDRFSLAFHYKYKNEF